MLQILTFQSNIKFLTSIPKRQVTLRFISTEFIASKHQKPDLVVDKADQKDLCSSECGKQSVPVWMLFSLSSLLKQEKKANKRCVAIAEDC